MNITFTFQQQNKLKIALEFFNIEAILQYMIIKLKMSFSISHCFINVFSVLHISLFLI